MSKHRRRPRKLVSSGRARLRPATRVVRVTVMSSPPARPSTPIPKPLRSNAKSVSTSTNKSTAKIKVPSNLHPPPTRLSGVDLHFAEFLVHTLLQHAHLTPIYHLPPPLPSLPIAVHTFLSSPLPPDSLCPPFHAIPPAVDPAWRPARFTTSRTAAQPIPTIRSSRKRQQLRFLVSLLAPYLSKHDSPVIHDLCAGSGHVGLLLAALFPHASVTLVDDGTIPLQLAADRIQQAGLTNVFISKSPIQASAPSCDVVIALHACAGASEAVLSRATAAKAQLVVLVPCCVGGVVTSRGSVTGASGGNGGVNDLHNGTVLTETQWRNARSRAFRSALSGDEDYSMLVKAADFGESGSTGMWRRVAKACIDWDRLLWLKEAGFEVRLAKLRPLEATPKNDVLVAWRPDAPVDMEWQRDEIANGVVADVAQRSVASSLQIDEMRDVERILREAVCTNDASGIYSSPPASGRRRRKVVHAVADMLGLTHESVGKGVDRVVVVRRTPHWPVYFESYIGISGPRVVDICDSLSRVIPKAYVERRVALRGVPVHLTLVGPLEISQLPEKYKKDRVSCAREAFEALKGTSFQILGVGRVIDIKPVVIGAEDNGNNETMFAVVLWPEAQKWRRSLGLGDKDFHITLGFQKSDIHNVPKDASTIFHPSAHTCSPWLT